MIVKACESSRKTVNTRSRHIGYGRYSYRRIVFWENTNSIRSLLFFFAFWEFSSRFLSSVNTAIILRGHVITHVLSYPCTWEVLNHL